MDQQNENVKKISFTDSLERGQEEVKTKARQCSIAETNLSKDQFKAAYGTDPPSWIKTSEEANKDMKNQTLNQSDTQKQ